MENKLTEQEKVRKLYNLIGERGLYVNTNYDVFSEKPEEIPVLAGAYKLPIINPGTNAYNSTLLFATLTSLLNHGTMLVTGSPGIGKTTGLEFAGHFFSGISLDEILEAEIQGNPQLKTEDVIASLDTVKMVYRGEKEVLPTKFLRCPVKLWDEVNRTPADLVSCAMKLVDTGKAVYQGVLLESPPGPLFVTANYADEGTFQLTPPFLDRFDVATMTTSPQPWDLRKIRQRGDEKLNGGLDKLLVIDDELKLDFGKIRKEISSIPETSDRDISAVSSFADFLYASLRFSESASDNLARATKGNAWQVNQDNSPPGHFIDSPFTYTINELTIRTAKAMARYAKAFAWINGKSKVELNDLKTIIPYLLWHKVQPTQKALAENPKYANDRISFIENLVTKVEQDYTELQGSDSLKSYSLALEALQSGTLLGKKIPENKIDGVVKNAISTIGNTDKAYALTLASHLASEYNRRYNKMNTETFASRQEK